MTFVYFRVILAAVVLGKTKESYSTMWTTLAVLCHVAEEIFLLGDEKKKKRKMMIEREKEIGQQRGKATEEVKRKREDLMDPSRSMKHRTNDRDGEVRR